MKLHELSIKKPVTVFMGLICVLVLGLLSYRQLKLSFLPKVDFPMMFVQVIYPNQNPVILEKEVTRPLEEALSTIKGVKKIRSNTGADQVSVSMEFSWGMELDLIRLEVGLKLEEIKPQLPEGIRQISLFSFDSQDIPVVEARISAPGIDLSENYDLLERHIQQKIERIPGVAQVELGGILPKEVYIELLLDKINAHKVDVGNIITALAQDNINLASGKINANGLVFNVRSQGKIDTLETFENLVINDSGLRLKDVANVNYEEPPIGYRRHLDGGKALALTVFKESTANTVEVANAVNDIIKNEIANDPLLKGISLFVWQDQAKEITNGLDGLTRAGLYGALFAVLILFLFLRRLSATLIIATAIPISVIGAFIAMYAFGHTLNVLTMMGLMLAVGMLVDNAVVVLESIYAKSQEGLGAAQATVEGTREVIIALIAATSTTMIVFLSLAVSDNNEISVWLGAIGLTICMTLAMSLLVSTTVIPLFASKLLTRSKHKKRTTKMLLLVWYEKLLNFSLRHQVITGICLVALVFSAKVPFGKLGQFKGTSYKTSRLFLRYELHDFFFLSDAENVVDKVEAYLESQRKEWDIKSIYSYMEENLAQTTILFNNEHLPFEDYKAIRKEMRDGLPAVPGVSFVFEDDDNESSQSIRLQLFGTDTDQLNKVGAQVVTLLEGIPGLFDLRSGERSNKKELQVSVNREKANQYGVEPQTISEVFGFTLGGTNLPRYQNGDRETDVSMGLRLEDRASIEDISQLRMGPGILLGSLAEFNFADRPEQIRRVDRKAHLAVRATYEGDKYGDMLKEVEARMNDFSLPPGVSWSWNSRILEEQNEMNSMLLNLALALILVYLVMASLFESIIQPLFIMLTLPFSFVGVGWLLYFTKTDYNLMAIIGSMILVGIVVNNGIIMMDRINQLRERGMDIKEAVRQGASDRIRPILMTASTTIIGLVPMAIGNSGIGGAYYFPLARTVIGGLGSATVLTLIGLPTIILTGHALWGFLKKAFWWVFGKKSDVPSSLEQSAAIAGVIQGLESGK